MRDGLAGAAVLRVVVRVTLIVCETSWRRDLRVRRRDRTWWRARHGVRGAAVVRGGVRAELGEVGDVVALPPFW